MTTFLAFLRAINLGGATQVAMAELRERVAAAGFEDVRSILQSGNLVFRGAGTDARAVERTLDGTVAAKLVARTEFFVRTAAEWGEVVAQNPFPREAVDDPGHLLVVVLKAVPPPRAWKALQEAIVGRERVIGRGPQAYIVYPDGVGRSKLTAQSIERHLGTRGTSRNWNTVRKMDALAAG